MKKIVISSLIALSMAFVIGFGYVPAMEQKAACADCDTNNLNNSKDIFLKFTEECERLATDSKGEPKKCFVSNIYTKIVGVLKGLAKDNRFGPGDRILFIGETQNGNLLAGADRAFQAGAPSDKDSMTVEVNKLDGGNGAIVKICTVDENLKVTRVGTINFAEDNTTGAKTATISGIQGKIVRIDIASFGSAVKKFKYTLKTSQ